MNKLKQKYFDPRYQSLRHPFHILKPSPWPFFTALSILTTTFGAIFYMHMDSFGIYLLMFGLFYLILNLVGWWRDVIIESTYKGEHTDAVRQGIRYGMILFIVSEVMFFFSFFWAFFHSSLSPAMEIGFVWPPKGIICINPWGLPLLNTFILLLSGASMTWAHLAVINNKKRQQGCLPFVITIFLGLLFTGCQLYEYINAPFDISDGIYGSIFYVITGFHGFHVIVGTVFIVVNFFRYAAGHFNAKHHVGLECAVWYWHFVDVIWILLFVSLYWWGSNVK